MKKLLFLFMILIFCASCEAKPINQEKTSKAIDEAKVKEVVFEDSGVSDNEVVEFSITENINDIKVSFNTNIKEYVYTLSPNLEIWELNIKVKH